MVIGMKIYSQDWFWKYRLGYDEAAAELKSLGVDYVITSSTFLPMSDSAVASETPPDMARLLESYDDKKFRDALGKCGIAYYGACNVFFDPALMHKHGNIPVDDCGEPHEQIDWYYGGCPTHEVYVEEQASKIENAMRGLNMDGVFLGFMRFPGFWELWLPGTTRGDWREYCFCERCIGMFQHSYGFNVPDIKKKGEWIRSHCYKEYTDFKTGVIHGVIGKIRNRVCEINPNAKILLNTVPFDAEHYGTAGRDIFAQDPELLSDVVDIFEVMGYHQILARPVEWIAKAGRYFKSASGKSVMCTLQAQPLYLDGMHAGKGRAESITPEDLRSALEAIRRENLDGAVFFTWSDFLKQQFEDNDLSYLNEIKNLKGAFAHNQNGQLHDARDALKTLRRKHFG